MHRDAEPGAGTLYRLAPDHSVQVAMCFGGCVLGFDQYGELRSVVEVPATLTTSVAFGGPSLDLLFVTTGQVGLSQQELSQQPHAGSVFVARTGTIGLPPTSYAG